MFTTFVKTKKQKQKTDKIPRNNQLTITSETKKKPKIRRKNFTTRSQRKSSRQSILPQEIKENHRDKQRKSSRLRNQPRKDYKIFNPQSKISEKVEFQKILL